MKDPLLHMLVSFLHNTRELLIHLNTLLFSYIALLILYTHYDILSCSKPKTHKFKHKKPYDAYKSLIRENA